MSRLPGMLSNPRVILGLAVALVLATGGGYAVVADVHGPVAWGELDTERPPSEVAAAVDDRLRRVDHRRTTRVYNVTADNTTRERELLGVYRSAHDFSNYQYRATYTRLADGPDGTLFSRHLAVGVAIGGPVRFVQYADDTRLALGYEVGVESLNDTRGFDWNETRMGAPNATLAPAYRPLFARGVEGWEVRTRNESTVVLGLDDPDAVYRALPRAAVEIHDGSRLRLVLDADTGRPRKLVEHRVVGVRFDGVERRTYRLVTTFGDWRTLDIETPAWVKEGGFDRLVDDVLYY